MKKIIFLITMSYSLLFSGEIIWEKSYQDAVTKALKDKKSIMLMLSSEGCYACEYMKNGSLKADSVVKYISQNFVPVELLIYQDDYPKQFDTPGTPSFFFIDPNTDKRVGKDIIGGLNEKTFLEELKTIKSK